MTADIKIETRPDSTGGCTVYFEGDCVGYVTRNAHRVRAEKHDAMHGTNTARDHDEWTYHLPGEGTYSHPTMAGAVAMIAKHLRQTGAAPVPSGNSHLSATDRAILAARMGRREEIQGPRVGDFLILPTGHTHRLSYDWGDGMQHSWGGSFHLEKNGRATYSGGLEPTKPKSLMVDTGETRDGLFWFFSRGEMRAHNGVDVALPCRVYRLVEAMADA